jgi:hypothetical protein
MRQNLNNRFEPEIRSQRMPAGGSLRRLILVLGCILLSWFSVAPLSAQPAAHPLVSSNRFLFVVDTSAAMKRNLDAMLSVVGETISSSANGQLRPGDSLGIWTYNQKLSVELPVQEWDPDLRPRIAYRAVAYLKAHRYEKTSSFDKVLPDIMRVIGSSRNILVFIISNGELNMSGTPFDDEFNKTYRQNLKDMRGQKMPIVTILVGKDGKLDRYTINPLPWPIVIPELPAPPQPLPEKAVLPQPPAPVVPRKIGQPLILHGPDNPTPAAPIPAPAVVQVAAAPAPAPTPLPAPPAATPPAVNSATVTPPAVTPVIAAATTTEPAKNETPPIAPAPIAKTPAPTAGPAPTPPVSAATPPPAPKPVPTADQVKSSEPAPAAPAVKPAAPTETVSAAPRPPESLSNPAVAFIQPEAAPQRSNGLLALVFALIAVALVLVVFMVRRARMTSGPSLITSSMRNAKK